MRESRTFGSVGGEGGNVLAYPAIKAKRHQLLEAQVSSCVVSGDWLLTCEIARNRAIFWVSEER